MRTLVPWQARKTSYACHGSQADLPFMQGQNEQALRSTGLHDGSKQGLAAHSSGAWHANEAFATGADSPRSQLEVSEQDLQCQGNASSSRAFEEGAGRDTRDASDHADGAVVGLDDAQPATDLEGTSSWSASCIIAQISTVACTAA